LLSSEYATLGLYISGHPLAKFAGRLQQLAAVELATLEGRRAGEDVAVAGVVVNTRAMRSRKGERWAIYTLQDMSGTVELLVFPEAFARLESVFRADTPLVVRGRVAVEEVGTRLMVSDARPLEDGTEPGPSRLCVRVNLEEMDELTLEHLERLFERKPGGCRVFFQLVHPDGSVATLEAERRVRPDRELVEAVREMCGPEAVQVIQ
jgi:DNA polymerase III subunit alpha